MRPSWFIVGRTAKAPRRRRPVTSALGRTKSTQVSLFHSALEHAQRHRRNFERYRDAFNALDSHAIADLYAEPSGIAQAGTYTHWPTRRSVRDNMDALCALYRTKGYARATFEASEFMSQGSQYAIADLLWHIDWTSDAQPWSFRTTYNIVRTQQGWKVLLCTAYEEDRFFKTPSAA